MSDQTDVLERWLAPHRRGGRDPHYLAFFSCFNGGHYFEAHEVLERHWLPQRHGRDAAFFQALIQIAGAFVHLEKHRPGPALALLGSAERRLETYAPVHLGLDVTGVLERVRGWRSQLEAGSPAELLRDGARPQLGPPR